MEATWPRRKSFKTRCLVRGASRLPEYLVWRAIINRCENPLVESYRNYGGRGIKVCERWHVFENFIADMGRRPHPRLTVERVDNSGDYCKKNCIWATRKEQNSNRRDNVFLTFEGKTKTLSEWARLRGLLRETLRDRIRRGWDHASAITRPLRGELR